MRQAQKLSVAFPAAVREGPVICVEPRRGLTIIGLFDKLII